MYAHDKEMQKRNCERSNFKWIKRGIKCDEHYSEAHSVNFDKKVFRSQKQKELILHKRFSDGFFDQSS